jgi:hypothetical protein
LEELNQLELEALAEAVRSRKAEETFENALGRVLRRADQDYACYVKVIGSVRQVADRKGVPMSKAAKLIVKRSKQQ